jgi:ribonuclease E
MAQLNIPQDYSVIIRTAGIGRSSEELQWDLDYLTHLWDAISKAATERPAPFLIYQESNLVIRAIRDYLRADIGEILIDNPEIFERAQRFMQQVMPQNMTKLKLYEDETPLFSRFQIEHQIQSAYAREVRLEAGGAIVFDKTEALVTIDVNSARATKGSDIEETALNTNLEAADELARQLRLRDLGGLIVIDFIDMTPERSKRAVENRLIEALKADRARVQVGRISRFGLLEMSRQRLRPSLGEASMLVCPRCDGMGHIRTIQSLALHVLRTIQEEAMKENTAALHVHLPVDTATFLLNEKRYEISAIETRLGTPVVIIPDPEMETPHYHVRRLRSEEYDAEIDIPSYDVEFVEAEDEEPRRHERAAPLPQAEKPAVREIAHAAPPPAAPVKVEKKPGLFTRLFGGLLGGGEPEPAPAAPAPSRRPPHARGPHPHRRPEHRDHHRDRGPRPPHPGGERRPQPPSAEARGEGRPQPTGGNGDRTPQGAPGRERGEGGRRRRRGRRGRSGTGRPQEGGQRVTPPSAGGESASTRAPAEPGFVQAPERPVEAAYSPPVSTPVPPPVERQSPPPAPVAPAPAESLVQVETRHDTAETKSE